jgi:hypothetical protein
LYALSRSLASNRIILLQEPPPSFLNRPTFT